jgi:hypothetical protein
MLQNSIFFIPVWVLVVIAVGLAAVLGFGIIRRRGNVHRKLNRAVRRISADQLRDIIIPDAVDGQIHIDRLLLTEKGALVVDFKNVSGTVFAGERLDEWAIMGARGRQALRNPLHGLRNRVMAVRALSPDLPVEGRIIFSDGSEFPKGRPENVWLLGELLAEPRISATPTFQQAWTNFIRRVAPAQPSPIVQDDA